MHENTHKFLKFDVIKKKLVLSNHDSDNTIFMIEQGGEIMQNDNQIIKSGQSIKFKLASQLHKNLYLSLYHSDNEIENNKEEIPKFDLKLKKYSKEPDLIIEENSNMIWRFNVYSHFTQEEKVLFFGDFVNIVHCESSGFLSSEQMNDKYKKRNKEMSLEIINEYNVTEESSLNSFFFESNVSDEIEHNKDLMSNEFEFDCKFYLKNLDNNKDEETDVNSCWIIENIFKDIKRLSFVRYYEKSQMDTYKMAFRLKNFKTNKYLSIVKIDNDPTKDQLNENGYFVLNSQTGKKYYKFGLVEGSHEENILSSEYYHSLFAFYPSIKQEKNNYKVEKNHFIQIYHISTKSFLKLITNNNKKEKTNSIDAVLTLSRNIEDHEVFKIISIDNEKVWCLKFLKNLLNLLWSIILHIKNPLRNEQNTYQIKRKDSSINYIKLDESIFSESYNLKNIKYSIIKSIKFIIDKLNKFIMNRFINKLNQNYDYDVVVSERQLLIFKFGFHHIIIFHFIYEFWIKNVIF